SATEADFAAMFPDGQDIEFIEDFSKRVAKRRAAAILRRLFALPVHKTKVRGIHGTLFYQLTIKKRFYPTKKESEMPPGSRPLAVQAVYAAADRRKRRRT
ncbi:MAG TPA: hypothetical protein VF334_02630, partial [Polyangia bacterium]